jgi:hypothetical protein
VVVKQTAKATFEAASKKLRAGAKRVAKKLQKAGKTAGRKLGA